MINNQFAYLDAQSNVFALAQVHTEELAHPNACPICGDSACDGGCDHAEDPLHDAAAYAHDDAPDAHLDASFEERTELEEAPYDGGGWPGDGSGTDDLADLMAHGDEGCCDGPED